jgi:hypothetical protein
MNMYTSQAPRPAAAVSLALGDESERKPNAFQKDNIDGRTHGRRHLVLTLALGRLQVKSRAIYHRVVHHVQLVGHLCAEGANSQPGRKCTLRDGTCVGGAPWAPSYCSSLITWSNPTSDEPCAAAGTQSRRSRATLCSLLPWLRAGACIPLQVATLEHTGR